MRKYIIYKHTIMVTQKSYIGFTSLTMEKRLHKHFLNAQSGIYTKFYNALNKYGMDSIKSEVLSECYDQDEAIDLEEFYIKKYDTYRNGYNSTSRGGGGWIIGNLSIEKQIEYLKKRSDVTTGSKNPNYSGYTDDQIVEGGAKFYIENGEIFNISKWYLYCDEYGYPKTFSKFRFNGEGIIGFKKRICDYLKIDNLNKYTKTDEHRKNISISISKKCWITNGIDTKSILKDDLEKYPNWYIGRTFNKKK